MIDAKNAWPLSELSHVHTGGCQSLTKSTKYEILQVRHINSHFPQQEKSYTELSYGTQTAGYIFTQTGGHKTSPPESFVLRAKCSQGKRFIWPHYVCMVRLVQPSFLLDTFLAH